MRGPAVTPRIAAASALLAVAASLGPAAAGVPLVGHVPLRFTPEAADHYYHFTPQHLAEDASLLSLHFDFFGVPWAELMAGGPLPSAWLAQMDAIAELRRRLGLPVLLSLTPLAGTRDRLAPRAHGEGERLLIDDALGGAACTPLGSRPDAAQVEEAYQDYVDWMVARFRPDYLALSIEVNLYRWLCPQAWGDLEAMLNRVYERQKAQRPGLPTFHTFMVDFLWEALTPESRCVGFDRTCLEENTAAMGGLQGDLFALSTYPWGTRVVNGGLPADFLTVFRELTGKPVAVAETGYQAFPLQEVDPEDPGECVTTLPSSLADQAWWMQRLLADGAAADMPFVVWWSDHDLMPEHAAVPCHCTVPDDPFCQVLATAPPADAKLLRSFSTMGVRDFDGAPRPSLVPWQAAAAARRLPDPPDGTPSLTSGAFPGFRFQVIIDPGDRPIPGQSEVPCLAETLS